MLEQQVHTGRGRTGRTEIALGLFGMVGVGLALAVPEARWVGVGICLLTAAFALFLYRKDFASLPYWLFRRRVHLPLVTLDLQHDAILALLVLILGVGVPAYVIHDALTTGPKQVLKPTLALEPSGRDELYAIVTNVSETTAHMMLLGGAIFDLDTPEAIVPSPGTRVPLPVVSQDIQFLKPFTNTGKLSLFTYPRARGKIVTGHRLFGYITVDCSDCDVMKAVWIYMVVGKGGWYSPMQRFFGSAWFYNLLPTVAEAPDKALSFITDRRDLGD